jgi:hypothetical protein
MMFEASLKQGQTSQDDTRSEFEASSDGSR